MNIIIQRSYLLPASCRKPRLFRAACLQALGRKAQKPGELGLIFMTNREIRRMNKNFLGHDWNTDVIAFSYDSSPPRRRAAFGEPRLRRGSIMKYSFVWIPAFAGMTEWRNDDPSPFGDIFVSVDQARIQALDLGHSLLEELLILAAHGTLHLMGYDDHAPKDRLRMFARQKSILRRALDKTRAPA